MLKRTRLSFHRPADQESVEVEIRSNERELKRALKSLSDKGGVPNAVGTGLLNAFINLEDGKAPNAIAEEDEEGADSDDED